MKTKNQTGREVLELAVAAAANEDGFTSPRDVSASRKQVWSPLEVWRTRVKTSSRTPVKPAQL